MTRIYATLATFALLMIAVALVMGLSIRDLRPRLERHIELQQQLRQVDANDPAHAELATEFEKVKNTPVWANVHRLFGLATVIIIMLVNSVAITYFVGTSRWVREVSDAYSLDMTLATESQRLKRRSFPWSVVGMCTAAAIAGFGAAGDPASYTASEALSTAHLIIAFAGVAFIAYAMWVQWNRIGDNHRVIEKVLVEVNQKRAAAGAEVQQA